MEDRRGTRIHCSQGKLNSQNNLLGIFQCLLLVLAAPKIHLNYRIAVPKMKNFVKLGIITKPSKIWNVPETLWLFWPKVPHFVPKGQFVSFSFSGSKHNTVWDILLKAISHLSLSKMQLWFQHYYLSQAPEVLWWRLPIHMLWHHQNRSWPCNCKIKGGNFWK